MTLAMRIKLEEYNNNNGEDSPTIVYKPCVNKTDTTFEPTEIDDTSLIKSFDK